MSALNSKIQPQMVYAYCYYYVLSHSGLGSALTY